jgi:hypothetical protein
MKHQPRQRRLLILGGGIVCWSLVLLIGLVRCSNAALVRLLLRILRLLHVIDESDCGCRDGLLGVRSMPLALLTSHLINGIHHLRIEMRLNINSR